jgi:uncharacterized protein DUF6458
MGIGIGLIVTAVGFILALAVHPSNPGSVDVNTVGWILVVVGLVGLILDLLLWESWGPAYLRRDVAVARGPGSYPRRRARRTIVEEEVPPAGPPAGPPGPGY